MNEIKNIVFIIIAFIVWSLLCVGGGYLYSNRTSVQLVNAERARSAEKNRQYGLVIEKGRRENEVLRTELSALRSDMGNEIQFAKTGVGNILSILEEVGSQRFSIQEDNGRWYIVGFSSAIFQKIKE